MVFDEELLPSESPRKLAARSSSPGFSLGRTIALAKGAGGQRPDQLKDWHLPDDRSRDEKVLQWFDALNNVNLGLPNGNRSSSAFGRITTAGDPRILQFALRVGF